jgi:pimeloyl-ACP methyl ester carboxylesterase
MKPKETTAPPVRHSGHIDRRDFIAASSAALGAIAALPQVASAQAANPGIPLDLAEWSYFWVGVERAELAKGTVANGKQMYVEYWIPREVKHPYPIVLVHGGGGQGLDWMGTPDGRRGWATILVEQGYKVYVVDRPGHGKSPLHPETHGGFPAQNITLESMEGRFTTPQPHTTGTNDYQKKYHNQWPGTGAANSVEIAQMVASQGGSYVAGATPDVQHQVWRERGAMLLDKIGPAVIMTHSAGGPFGWLVAEIRPRLVKGIVAIEGGGQPFGGANRWGMSTIPVTFDPPIKDPSELKLVDVPSPEPGVQPYKLQAEPARKLKNLKGIPIVIVTAEGSFASPGNPGGVAMLKQAGCQAEELRYVNLGVKGNGHFMMGEKNNREALKPLTDWIEKNVEAPNLAKGEKIVQPKPAESALKLADTGYFWVGTERKKMPYGTIISGQMFVQYLIPQQVTQPFPIVLVHGGAGQGTHYTGRGDGEAGWAHYYAQAGYKVYIVDRPGHGRAPLHPDALGPVGPVFTYQSITGDFKRAAEPGPNRRWAGTGDVGDPQIDQFQAGQTATPVNNGAMHALWGTRGAELLDKIGPAIVQVHSAGGPFSFMVASERPNLVKAIVNFEGANQPFAGANVWGLTGAKINYTPAANDPKELATKDVKPANGPAYKIQADAGARKVNFTNVPIAFVTAHNSGRTMGPAVADFLKQAGCTDVTDFQMADKKILGNGHFAMWETNRKEFWDQMHAWIQTKVKA